MVRLLIEAGAEVNPAEKGSVTSLHLAAQEGRLSVVRVLLNNNADAGKCCNGLNALDVAIDYGRQ